MVQRGEGNRNVVVPIGDQTNSNANESFDRRSSLAKLVSKANMKRFVEERSSDFQGEVSKGFYFKARNLELQFRKYQVNQQHSFMKRFYKVGLFLAAVMLIAGIVSFVAPLLVPNQFRFQNSVTNQNDVQVWLLMYSIPLLCICISALVSLSKEIDVDSWKIHQLHTLFIVITLIAADLALSLGVSESTDQKRNMVCMQSLIAFSFISTIKFF
jgi:hypothetical protein